MQIQYGRTNFQGGIYNDGYSGKTIVYEVETPYGTRQLSFRDGLLIGFT